MTEDVPKAPDKTVSPHSRADFEMNTTQPDNSRIMWAASAIIMLAALAAGVIAITPKVKDIASQKEKIATLQAELAEAKKDKEQETDTANRLKDMQSKLVSMSEQARQLQSGLSTAVVEGKLSELEDKFNTVLVQSRSATLNGMMAKLQMARQSPEGVATVDKIVSTLAASQTDDVGQDFEALRSTDPQVAGITEGIAPEDMKAAAMLIAMAEVRDSLQRGNNSFETDLALLKKTVPETDTALLAAIDRLAPQAKYGVLTPQGLSRELRGMTGEIVSASLSGQNISMKEKAQARLGNLFLIEKNGQRISGTDSQIAIAAAQKELDKGNVQSAVDILKTLDGPAAQKTRPFLEKAQATLLAGDLQTIMSRNVVQDVKNGLSGMMRGAAPGIVNPYSTDSITNKIKSYVPASPSQLGRE